MSGLTLSDEDRQAIELLRRKDVGVLCNVSAHLINETNGAMVVTCSDSDQLRDVFRHHEKVCRHHRANTRIHMFSLNGGAKLIAESSPLRVHNEDQVLLAHITAARSMKQIETVVLYAHAPCGAAYGHDLPFYRVLELLFEGKERVKREIPGIKVACFCHIDYGNNKKRTYFVSRERWVDWVQKSAGQPTR